MRRHDEGTTAIQGMINTLEAYETDIRQTLVEGYEDFDQWPPETRRKLAEMLRAAQRLSETLRSAQEQLEA